MSSARGAEPAKEGRRRPVIRLPVSVFVFDHVAGRGEVGDDGVGAALGDPDRRGDVAQAGPGVVGDIDQGPGMVGEEAPLFHRLSSEQENSRN